MSVLKREQGMSIYEWVLPGAGQQFNGNDFRDLLKPGVYVFMLGDAALYVGMGQRILGRVGSKHKQAADAIEQADKVLLYPCISVNAAKRLEKLLICRLKPRDNWRQRTGLLRDWLGLSESSPLSRFRDNSCQSMTQNAR